MARTIYLAVFANGSKPAHWAVWIPTTGQEYIGKLIHVIGNPSTGFFLEFKRNYNFKETYRKYEIIHLAVVQDRHVTDTPGTETTDTTARDRIGSKQRHLTSSPRVAARTPLIRQPPIARTGYATSLRNLPPTPTFDWAPMPAQFSKALPESYKGRRRHRPVTHR
ncbi:hypothetical protein BU26DRAFT_521024 [Trematosphaeria pertusa]|uniref:Uncharacterized protein n=1 Tax=Trematosphaeria pertusa TaxID=390896 RepID=A0A6A6IAK9_9PLEO|nr:uncharacterized protein BU26DRAFT_521024 [Trematosphaeria pertusa]KAF2246570.1 hypothetical protein BU26DRAFT_521024 [Trematosphaeria pertusa]